nr:uncharacterized protein LOC109160243 isoform X2 [Ipomoea trifida]
MNEQSASMMNQQQQMMSMSQSQMMGMNSHPQLQQPPVMNRSYGMWPQAPPPPAMDQMNFPNPSFNAMQPQGFVMGKQSKPLRPRSNWKGKKMNKIDKRMDAGRRNEKSMLIGTSSVTGTGAPGGGPDGASGGYGGYQPPTLNELQQQNRLKARRFFPKKKFHNFNNNSNNRDAPFAPRNTTSFIIRAKKSGGIASLVSPYPVTPAVLPTPNFSPSREVVVDMAKEEWGLDGYGSMKGLIRLRSPGQELEPHEDEDEEDGESSESDVEEHVEVERRLDHDLSRFEMIYPNHSADYNNVLENRVDDQDTHIAQLEEENLILKERLFLMERELGDLRRRLQSLERQNNGEAVANESDSETESFSDAPSVDNNVEIVVENEDVDVNLKSDNTNDGGIETAESEGNIVKGTQQHWNNETFEEAEADDNGAKAAESKHKKSDMDLQEKEDKKQQDVDMKEDSDRLNVEASENDELSLVDVSIKEASHMDDEMNV